MLISGKQAFVGGEGKYESPKNDCVGGYEFREFDRILSIFLLSFFSNPTLLLHPFCQPIYFEIHQCFT